MMGKYGSIIVPYYHSYYHNIMVPYNITIWDPSYETFWSHSGTWSFNQNWSPAGGLAEVGGRFLASCGWVGLGCIPPFFSALICRYIIYSYIHILIKMHIHIYIYTYEDLATAQLKEKLGNWICTRIMRLKFVNTSPTLISVNDPA